MSPPGNSPPPQTRAEWRQRQDELGLCRECTRPVTLVRLKNGRTKHYKLCDEHLAADRNRKAARMRGGSR